MYVLQMCASVISLLIHGALLECQSDATSSYLSAARSEIHAETHRDSSEDIEFSLT